MHRVVDDWLRLGRSEPRPVEVERHLQGCPICAQEMQEADELRLLLQTQNPAPVISSQGIDAIRFRLESTARQSEDNVLMHAQSPLRHSGVWRRRWLLVAGLFAWVLTWGVLEWESQGETAAPTASSEGFRLGTPDLRPDSLPAHPVSNAKIEPELGAIFSKLSPLPQESYRIRRGAVWFTVSPLGKNQAFHVVVGSHTVVVHGTRFRVEAFDDQLVSVEVDHGEVVVLHRSDEVQRLHAQGRYATRIGSNDDPEPVRQLPVRRRYSTRPATSSGSAPRNHQVDSEFQVAWTLYQQGRYDASAFAFDRILKGLPPSSNVADFLFWSGRSHLSAGRREKARERFTQLILTSPDSWHASNAEALLNTLSPQP